MIRKIQLVLISFALLISCLLSCFIPTTNTAAALNIEVVGGYTNVLEDLQKDENFNADNYPIIKDDYSLQVIQIAESSDKELLVYVYQPSAEYENLIATSINISTGKGLELSFKNYTLDLINNQGCFYKYRINDFIVSDISERYYEITSIYRAWNEKYDESIEDENGNIINEVPFKVAKHYTFTTTDNGIELIEKDVDVIEVTDKYVGFVRYEDGGYSSLFGAAWGTYLSPGMDSHFVAFSTDKEIDKLMEADVYFQTQTYHYEEILGSVLSGGGDETWGSIENNYSYINYTQRVEEVAGNYKYEFNRIQTVEEFEETENYEFVYNGIIFNSTTEVKLTEEGKQNLKGKQWVLRFYESDYADYVESSVPPLNSSVSIDTKIIDKTLVSNVTILRLKFETNDIVYNLGVIDNKQTGDGNPDNYTKTTLELNDTFKIILSVLFLILLVVVLGPFLPTIISIFVWAVKLLFKLVIWVISLPIKLFKWLFSS